MTYSDVGSMELWAVDGGQGRNNLITVRGHLSCLMLQVPRLQTLGGE